MTAVHVDDLEWQPPGPGLWFSSPEHMPTPGCGLLIELLPFAGPGWGVGAARYGLPPNLATFGASNRWFFYSPGHVGTVDGEELEELDRRAAETLATRRWRTDLHHWQTEVRPAVVARHRALLGVDLATLDDAALGLHVQQAVDQWVDLSPQHFSGVQPGGTAAGVLLHAAAGWGLDPRAVIEALAGAAAAASSVERLLERIADGVRAAGGVTPESLEAIRALGGDAAAALDELLVDYGWRVFHSDLLEPTLAERPGAILVGVRAALAGWGARQRPSGDAVYALREQVPAGDRAEFDELMEDARAAYGHNDDNTTVLFAMPLGLLRRAVLEVGRRLHDRGKVEAVNDVFEASTTELAALLAGGGPSAAGLAARSAELRAMAAIAPPGMIGEPLPASPPLELLPNTRRLVEVVEAFSQVAWTGGTEPGRAAVTVGSEVVRGRAVVVVDPLEALLRMEPGDVLVAASTTASFNMLFPVAGAVAVQHGGFMSHPAVLARELGLTAVIGVPDLLTSVADGDLVEVDPKAGTIRVIEPAG
jgi:phosphohistidine swiveling domain-containing protein